MNDSFYWLALSRMPGVGPITVKNWLTHFETIETLFQASVDDLQQAGVSSEHIQSLTQVNWRHVEQDHNWIQRNNGKLIEFTHPLYPPLLKEIYAPPLLLYVQGNIELLSQPQIAIVGTRHPTIVGSQLAEEFACELVAAGMAITSGLAIGIDGASHKGALAAQGKTIAVMATGLKHLYPACHQKLAGQIIAHGGVLVTEFPLATLPKPGNFPARNRIISGLSLGVLVVEAALKSGSLITAKNALEQNREVFAVPGSLRNPRARGCHQLIRQGAKLVEKTSDILDELPFFSRIGNSIKHFSSHTKVDFTPDMQRVYEYISDESTPFEVIMMGSGLTASEVSSMLLKLELEGFVQSVSGGYMRVNQR